MKIYYVPMRLIFLCYETRVSEMKVLDKLISVLIFFWAGLVRATISKYWEDKNDQEHLHGCCRTQTGIWGKLKVLIWKKKFGWWKFLLYRRHSHHHLTMYTLNTLSYPSLVPNSHYASVRRRYGTKRDKAMAWHKMAKKVLDPLPDQRENVQRKSASSVRIREYFGCTSQIHLCRIFEEYCKL